MSAERLEPQLALEVSDRCLMVMVWLTLEERKCLRRLALAEELTPESILIPAWEEIIRGVIASPYNDSLNRKALETMGLKCSLSGKKFLPPEISVVQFTPFVVPQLQGLRQFHAGTYR